MIRLLSFNPITALWSLFCVYWLLSAVKVRRTQQRESSAQRLGTVLVMGIATVLIFSRGGHFAALNRRFLPEAESIKALAILLVAAGLGLAIWARWHIGEFWSGWVTLKVDHQLIRSGPYARVRHPIYSGLLLAFAGTALYVGEWRTLLGFALVLVGLWQKARREEALLAGRFGAAYDEYCKHTGALIPRLQL
jgi:protein-S-isoprenylcysteine O-methyltransferase Ste14